MISEHRDFYVPNLATFQNNNAYLGSFHGLRFKLSPNMEADPPSIDTLDWYGLLCLELSEVVHTSSFPMTDEGYAEMLKWLDEEWHIMKEAEGSRE